jgi:hypothetical protein
LEKLLPASPENFDRSSFAIRKSLTPRLRQLVKTLGLRSVGDLVAMLAANDEQVARVLEPIAKAHLQGRELQAELQTKLADDPELQAQVKRLIERRHG